MTDLLDERKKKKEKQPSFNRDDYGKKDRVGAGWRNPSGHHNKIRLDKNGHPSPVKTGWGSPNEVRGLHPSGYEPVRVHNVDQLDELDEGEGAVVASNVGDRKRVTILERAVEQEVPVLNLDPESYLEQVEEAMEARREAEDVEEESGEEPDESGTDEDTEDENSERTDPEDHQDEMEEQKEKVLTKK